MSAVFEAFTTIVRRKTEQFYRIAGLNRESLERVPLNEALVKAIAQDACDVAGQFLNICIRAIDYCPPADMEARRVPPCRSSPRTAMSSAPTSGASAKR